MKRRFRMVGKILLFAAGIVAAIAVGWLAHDSFSGLTSSSVADSQKSSGISVAPTTGDYSGEASRSSAGSAGTADSSASSSTSTQDQLVVKYGSMSIEVKGLDEAIASVRKLVADNGGEIAQLTVTSGDSWVIYPDGTKAVTGTSSSTPSPRSASITLRIPADKLSAAETAAASLGTVLSETSSQSDVTQQHIDMKARLDNLIAEEGRLREFLGRSANVTEMLQVEKELSRVRGEIESLTAQIVYLDNQVALSTLTLYLTEPGSIVQPSGGTWGFSAAVRTGIQAAAAVLRATIIVLLAISPFLLLAVVVYVIRLLWVRRHRRASPPPSPEA